MNFKKISRRFKALKPKLKKKGIKVTDILGGGAAIRIASKVIEQRHIDSTVEGIEEIRDSIINPSSVGTSDSDGNPGDIKVNKISKNKYNFLIKGEDGWHRDTNASFSHINSTPDTDAQVSVMMENNGLINNQFNGISRFVWDLDGSSLSSTAATPKLNIKGNFDLLSTGNLEIKSGGTASSKNIKINPSGSTEIASTLKVSGITESSDPPVKFVVTNDNGDIQWKTKGDVQSGLGITPGADISAVTITTDSGAGSKATDNNGSADFSILGSNGVGVTNSSTTLTVTAVPGEIDHDSLDNFASNEHYTQANIVATGALNAGSITSGFDSIDTGSSAITTTGTISGGTINGSAVWQEFPFGTFSQTAARGYYMRDNDDFDDFRKWDDFDSDMVINYRKIYGHYIVPEDCRLTHMRGIISNVTGTVDPILNVWYCLQTDIATDTGDTTFTKAGSNETVSIGTTRVGVQFNEDYDVVLTAGSMIIPTIKHLSLSSQSYTGTLTLKFITR